MRTLVPSLIWAPLTDTSDSIKASRKVGQQKKEDGDFRRVTIGRKPVKSHQD
jgi:hypothetical protein